MRSSLVLEADRRLTWLYGGAIFVSAFLLFQIQPLISKYILPWFGGGTSVWTTAQVFFQAVLLGGYAYAHGLARLGSEGQGRLHLGVMGVVAAWLVGTGLRWGAPVTPDAAWKPAVGGVPALQVLGVLAVSVGLPYFLLSTSSSLLQAWYSRLRGGGSPYGFYVLSNAASLLALLSYPVVVEPALSLRQQALVWALGFGLYLILLALCAGVLIRCAPSEAPMEREKAAIMRGKPGKAPRQRQNPPAPAVEPVESAARPGWSQYLAWAGLAACGSTTLLAVTNQITQDVASAPFLWVLPLSLYLLTFIIGFNERVAARRGLLVVIVLIALGVGLLLIAPPAQLPLWALIAANGFVLLAVCLFCHTELYRTRPHPRHLTAFYLMLSLGGALGGAFVSLIAPAFFRGFWEFPIALLFCADLARQAAQSPGVGRMYRLRHVVTGLALALAVGIVLLPLKAYSDSFLVLRNFYGVLRVRQVDYEGVPAYNLVNGTITHGLQAMQGEQRGRPTSYFTPSSGAALAIANHPARVRDEPLRIGIVGLGVGTLAYYGQPGDVIRFYEINPQVIAVAYDERFFTYLRDSQAAVEIVEGDARLSMEREWRQSGSQQYDVFVIDAFSGDSIPAHLLSIEAIQLYLDHLRPDGVLAFHISNKYIALEPVLWRIRETLGLQGVYIHSTPPPGDPLSFDSFWVLLSRDSAVLDSPAIRAVGRALQGRPTIRLWTDDYSNLFQVLK